MHFLSVACLLLVFVAASALSAGVKAGVRSPITRQMTATGCFKDASNRELDGTNFSSLRMTHEACFVFCRIRQYYYMGVQTGHQCYCGNRHLVKHGRVDDKECNLNCAGDSHQKCGGIWRINVFRMDTPERPHQSLVPPSDLANRETGCFQDNGNRELDGANMSSGEMTLEMCYAFCSIRKYKYMGVESSDQCYCSSVHNEINGKHGRLSQTRCDWRCRGNSMQYCGGFWTINVYRIG